MTAKQIQNGSLNDDAGGPGTLRLGRYFLALALVPLPPVLLLAAFQFRKLGWLQGTLHGARFPLAGEILSFIVGSGYAFLMVRRNSTLRRSACLILGAVVGFPILMGGIVLRLAITGVITASEQNLLSSPFLMIGTGLVLVPFGLLGGWLLWRLAADPRSLAGSDPLANARLWRDLRMWRLWLGGLFSQVGVLVPLGAIGVAISSDQKPLDSSLVPMLLLAAWLVVCWPVLGAVIWIMLVVRPREIIRRADCVVGGALLAFLGLPLFSLFNATVSFIGSNNFVIFGIKFDADDPLGDLTTALVFGALLSPIGCLSGWLFWRIAIRPAPLPLPDVSTVFE